MNRFAAIVAFKENGETGGSSRAVGVGILGVKFLPFVVEGEGLPIEQGKGIQSVVRLVVVEAGGQFIQPPEAQERGREQGQDNEVTR